LMRERVLVDDGGMLRRNPEVHSFFDEQDLSARVDGLNRQMDVIAETVWTRWIEQRPGATARTFAFNASEADFETIVREVVDRVRERAIAADAAGRVETTKRRGITLAATNLEDPP
ncbi:MAG: hypothetical protein H0V89_05060, partial [Deltaproteobacteria bacterium]|nr:hypothetical protein [Deltaproteobacteria bacterium]